MIKQVIVIRKDLNMRKGKMIAQGAHASTKAILDEGEFDSFDWGDGDVVKSFHIQLSLEMADWLAGLFTKIVVGVNSEAELLDVYTQAKTAGLHCSLIQDAGLTEFQEPTNTAVAIGPGQQSEIDRITGHLKLL